MESFFRGGRKGQEGKGEGGRKKEKRGGREEEAWVTFCTGLSPAALAGATTRTGQLPTTGEM